MQQANEETPVAKKKTSDDSVWKQAKFDSATPLEFVVAAPGMPVTHIYRSAFPRSFGLLNLRPAAAIAREDADAAAIVRMDRPRGYFGIPRDIVLLDGKQPADVPTSVPTDLTHTKLKLAAVQKSHDHRRIQRGADCRAGVAGEGQSCDGCTGRPGAGPGEQQIIQDCMTMTEREVVFHAPPDGFAMAQPVHPGEILQEEIEARDLTAHAFALKLRITAR